MVSSSRTTTGDVARSTTAPAQPSIGPFLVNNEKAFFDEARKEKLDNSAQQHAISARSTPSPTVESYDSRPSSPYFSSHNNYTRSATRCPLGHRRRRVTRLIYPRPCEAFRLRLPSALNHASDLNFGKEAVSIVGPGLNVCILTSLTRVPSRNFGACVLVCVVQGFRQGWVTAFGPSPSLDPTGLVAPAGPAGPARPIGRSWCRRQDCTSPGTYSTDPTPVWLLRDYAPVL